EAPPIPGKALRKGPEWNENPVEKQNGRLRRWRLRAPEDLSAVVAPLAGTRLVGLTLRHAGFVRTRSIDRRRDDESRAEPHVVFPSSRIPLDVEGDILLVIGFSRFGGGLDARLGEPRKAFVERAGLCRRLDLHGRIDPGGELPSRQRGP